MGGKIALFDLDGTLAEYEGAIRRDLKPLMGPGETMPDDLWNGDSWIEARMNLVKRQPGWWRDLEPIEGCMRILHAALEIGFECHVLTKGPKKTTAAWTEKADWVEINCPEEVLPTITHKKDLVYGAILVDDYPGYIKPWLKVRPRGLAIMPDRQCNQGFSHPRVLRFFDSASPSCINVSHYVCNLDEAKHWLEAAFKRKHGEHAEIAV